MVLSSSSASRPWKTVSSRSRAVRTKYGAPMTRFGSRTLTRMYSMSRAAPSSAGPTSAPLPIELVALGAGGLEHLAAAVERRRRVVERGARLVDEGVEFPGRRPGAAPGLLDEPIEFAVLEGLDAEDGVVGDIGAVDGLLAPSLAAAPWPIPCGPRACSPHQRGWSGDSPSSRR